MRFLFSEIYHQRKEKSLNVGGDAGPGWCPNTHGDISSGWQQPHWPSLYQAPAELPVLLCLDSVDHSCEHWTRARLECWQQILVPISQHHQHFLNPAWLRQQEPHIASQQEQQLGQEVAASRQDCSPGAALTPKEEGWQHSLGFALTPQDVALAAALGWQPSPDRAWMGGQHRPLSLVLWENKWKERKNLGIVNKVSWGFCPCPCWFLTLLVLGKAMEL